MFMWLALLCFSDEDVETEPPKTDVWTDKPELHKIPLNKVNQNKACEEN